MPDDNKWSSTSLMASLSDSDRSALLAMGNRQHYHDKDVIVRQGEPGDSLYVLLAGVVKVTMTTESGLETTLATRQRGDLIGEVALFDDRPRAATAVASGEVAAVQISRAHFEAFEKRNPAAASTIIKSIVGKMRESDERLAQRSRQTPQRLALVLYRLALASADREPDGSVVIPQITQGDIARLADAGVASAERFIKDCKAKGILETGYRQMTVRDMPTLEKLANQQ
ncbi:MAG TPA: Crp/Fnr family transcriptional regulator [Trebonia sp.]|nr:Crp/Fnr family transcriptional regulator [Trebonia sp.]